MSGGETLKMNWKNIIIWVALDYFYLTLSFALAETRLVDLTSFWGRYLIFYLSLYLHFPFSLLFFGFTQNWIVFFFPFQTFIFAMVWEFLSVKNYKIMRWVIIGYYGLMVVLACVDYYGELKAFHKI